MLIAFCLLSLFCAWGQEEVLNQEALTDRYGGRIALVGQHCIVNQISTVANLMTNYDHLEYVTDEDLNNFATITAGVNAGVAVLPFFSVKDTKHTYAAGTKAGFTLVSTEGGGLLSLNVIKLFSIGVYNDGKLMETLDVEEGQGTGVGLELIKIPNSDDISVDLTVTPTYDFDELYLEYNGVNVYALQEFSIKYAFVGEAVELAVVRSVYEYREAVRVVAQHKVGATSHDDARLLGGKFADDFALCGKKGFRCCRAALDRGCEVFFEKFAYLV